MSLENQNVYLGSTNNQPTTPNDNHPHLLGLLFIFLGLLYPAIGVILYLSDPSARTCVSPTNITHIFNIFYGSIAMLVFALTIIFFIAYVFTKRGRDKSNRYYKKLFYYINPLSGIVILFMLFVASIFWTITIDCAV